MGGTIGCDRKVAVDCELDDAFDELYFRAVLQGVSSEVARDYRKHYPLTASPGRSVWTRVANSIESRSPSGSMTWGTLGAYAISLRTYVEHFKALKELPASAQDMVGLGHASPGLAPQFVVEYLFIELYQTSLETVQLNRAAAQQASELICVLSKVVERLQRANVWVPGGELTAASSNTEKECGNALHGLFRRSPQRTSGGLPWSLCRPGARDWLAVRRDRRLVKSGSFPRLASRYSCRPAVSGCGDLR